MPLPRRTQHGDSHIAKEVSMSYLWALPSATLPSKEDLKESSCVRYATKWHPFLALLH